MKFDFSGRIGGIAAGLLFAAALAQGFAVTGTSSRTAVGEAAGGRSQMTGLVCAAALALLLLYFTGPLRYVPSAAIAAALVPVAEKKSL